MIKTPVGYKTKSERRHYERQAKKLESLLNYVFNYEEMEGIYYSDDDNYIKPAWVQEPLFDLLSYALKQSEEEA